MLRYVITFFAGMAAGIALLAGFMYARNASFEPLPSPPPAAAPPSAPAAVPPPAEATATTPPLVSNEPLSEEPRGIPAPGTGSIEQADSTAPPPPPPDTGAYPAEAIVIPVAGVRRDQLRDHFDDARGGRAHRAIDIAAPRGTRVLAATDGPVAKLFLSRAGGITLYQRETGSDLIYYYAHLDGYADGIAEGKLLRRGELLGFVGTTGNAPPGTPHLHFAIERLSNPSEWWKGEPVNPYPVLMSRGVTAQ